MKSKEYKKKYNSKAKKKNKNISKRRDKEWVVMVTIIAFCLTFILSIFSESVLENVSSILGILVVLFFIFLGIIFDMIGIAVTVADPKVFNSMAAKKVKGAKTALRLMKNASKVSSFCNDVIGDICGILSGAATASIASVLVVNFDWDIFLATLVSTSLIASLTIGGKAWGKSVAINKANNILYHFSQVINFFWKES